jgi:hypothetical protein
MLNSIYFCLGFVFSGALISQSPLTTNVLSDNAGPVGGCVYFDLTVRSTLTITSFDVNTFSPLGTSGSLMVFVGPATWVGSSKVGSEWVNVSSGPVISNDFDIPSPCLLGQPITLAPGAYAFALQFVGLAPALCIGDGSNQNFSTAEIDFEGGGSSSTLFSIVTIHPQVFTGSIFYSLGGQPLPLASSSSFGYSCNKNSASIFESFPSQLSANGVDLDRSTFRFVPNLTGGYDVSRLPGSAIIPPGVPALPLGDDTISVQNTPFIFPYPGGSTNNLYVCSNGYIWLSYSHFADFSPSEYEMLDQPSRIMPAWLDLNPGAPGSGLVYYEIDPGNLFVTVTWNGVWAYGSNGAAVNRFQVVLYSSGVFELRYGQIRNAGLPCIVGFTQGNGNLELPCFESDFSAITHLSTSYEHGLTLSPPIRPILGRSIALATSFIPYGALVSSNVLTYVQFPFGIDLTALGAPGCMQFCSADAPELMLGSGTFYRFFGTLPIDPVWAGLEIFSQSVSLVPSANYLGVVTSNGVALKLGSL